MDIIIQPRLLRGEISVPPSKSMAHRYLICAALADNPTQLICPETNADIEATTQCLRALGADIIRTETGYSVFPISNLPNTATLPCGESGATLRFLLPVVGALGIDAAFLLEGRLPQRPLSPLWEELERMGCCLSRPDENTIRCTGKLRQGHYAIDGGISSQFVSGLLFALSLLPGSTLEISGQPKSTPYIDMTKAAMAIFRVPNYHSPGRLTVEGDWSSGAFWVAAAYLGSDGIGIHNLNDDSIQGDRAVLDLLPLLETGRATISAAQIPDLIPILSIMAAANHGAVFTDVHRLRYKESDRVAAIVDMVHALGGKAEATENTLTIHGTGLRGGTVDSRNDHRIAMSAAISATVCKTPVTILGAECVKKSYRKFWDDYRLLGGKYDQFLR